MTVSMVTITCERCGREVTLRHHRHAQRYCSKSCAASHRTNRSANSTSFQSGKSPWNKGMVGYLAGHTVSEETKQKIRESVTGERAPNWKGGISPENERFRKSALYRDWRIAVFTRDDYTCQECGDRSRAGHRIRIHADHIKPFALYPELRLDVDNGRTLCESCHRQTPTYGNGSHTGNTATRETPALHEAAD